MQTCKMSGSEKLIPFIIRMFNNHRILKIYSSYFFADIHLIKMLDVLAVFVLKIRKGELKFKLSWIIIQHVFSVKIPCFEMIF